MNNPAITLEGPDLRAVADGVLAMMLPPRLRRLWLSRMGRMVIAQAKKNVAEQKTVTGSAMTPRKNKEVKRKMLTGLVKSRWIGVGFPDDDTAKVKFFRNAGIVGRKHQLGGQAAGAFVSAINYPRAFDSAKISKSMREKRYTMPSGRIGCSANQAAMLIRLQFIPRHLRAKVPAGGAGAVDYLMQNVSREAAIFLIAEGVAKAGKTNLPDNTPARPFLGVDEEQKLAMGETIMNGIYERFKAKNHSELLK